MTLMYQMTQEMDLSNWTKFKKCFFMKSIIIVPTAVKFISYVMFHEIKCMRRERYACSILALTFLKKHLHIWHFNCTISVELRLAFNFNYWYRHLDNRTKYQYSILPNQNPLYYYMVHGATIKTKASCNGLQKV